MVHHRTQSCVRKANELLNSDDPDALRYASLQLRMAIEYVFYELLPLYRDELPDDITSKWQPKQIIDAILECDPTADQDAEIAISQSGVCDDGGDSSVVMVKQTKAPSKKLLKKHYHRLGFYLHAPVDLQQPEEAKWRKGLTNAIDALADFEEAKIRCNIRPLVEFDCDACGRTLRRNRHGVEATKEMRCLNPKCNAVYDVQVDDNETRWQLRQGHYDCPYCNEANHFSVGGIKDGTPITCGKCSKRVVVHSRFALAPIDGDSKEMA